MPGLGYEDARLGGLRVPPPGQHSTPLMCRIPEERSTEVSGCLCSYSGMLPLSETERSVDLGSEGRLQTLSEITLIHDLDEDGRSRYRT